MLNNIQGTFLHYDNTAP